LIALIIFGEACTRVTPNLRVEVVRTVD
jgi:hypothetical protein